MKENFFVADVEDFSAADRWDAYVSSHPGGLFFHRSGWVRTIAGVYGLRAFHLAAHAEDGSGALAGVLPLVLFDAPGRDRRLVSLPYTDAAGLLADDPAAARALLSGAWQLALALGAVHLELREAGESQVSRLAADLDCPGNVRVTAHDFKTGLTRPLPPTESLLWQDLPAKVRNQVRKARKSGCRAVTGGAELLDAFYEVFSQNMRDLGSPVHDKALFERLWATFPRAMRVVVVTIGGAPAAGAAVFAHQGVMVNPWASSLRCFRPLCPNMLLYWTLLCEAQRSGCRVFDFGRSSPDAATCRFKRQWGAGMTPLVWYVFSADPHSWHPARERLVYERVKARSLYESLRLGPSERRWISL